MKIENIHSTKLNLNLFKSAKIAFSNFSKKKKKLSHITFLVVWRLETLPDITLILAQRQRNTYVCKHHVLGAVVCSVLYELYNSISA